MKKHILIPLLSLAIAFIPVPAAIAETKIGTVDMKKIFESYWRTKEAESKMNEVRAAVKRDLEERYAKRKQLQERIEKLNDDIKKTEISKATAQAKIKDRDERIGEWQTMMRELQQYQADKEKDLADQTLRMRNGLVDEISKVVKEHVATAGYDLVFDVSGNSINNVPVIMYAKESFDFSKEIIEKLNADRGKTTTPEKPAEAPKTPKK